MHTVSIRQIMCGLAILLCAMLQACAVSRFEGENAQPKPQAVDALTQAILDLEGDIDADEAARAARISIWYSRHLAAQYEIVGSPLFHNMLVNLGIKERGLCVDWTRDLMVRLQKERFRSIDLHWGVANFDSAFRIEHSTVILSATGAGLRQGIVLDPWRNSGDLYWAPTLEDAEYAWRPQAKVLALKRQSASGNNESEPLR